VQDKRIALVTGANQGVGFQWVGDPLVWTERSYAIGTIGHETVEAAQHCPAP
jgi:hypothetical protein